MIDASGGPSLSRWVERYATTDHLRELAIHRSAYQLKEADPHTWAIPRLAPGRAKSALIGLQYDEYGNGELGRSHAELFAETMGTLDLDPAYGACLDAIPTVTLAMINLLSMFGLHRRWVPACIGHLAVFEMTSVTAMTRYAAAHRRVVGEGGAAFYDVHVTADALHSQVALLHLEERFAKHVLDTWSAGRGSLLPTRSLAIAS